MHARQRQPIGKPDGEWLKFLILKHPRRAHSDAMANATARAKKAVSATERPTATGGAMRAAHQVSGSWRASARRFVRRNPGAVFIGAFIVGIALAKVARHA